MSGYGQFCPVSKAAEIVCERWTALILRELISGSTRFNELRRGLPGCSTSLLSQRLRSLERAGVIRRGEDRTYVLTDAGWELGPVIEGLGRWGQRWARSRYTPAELDPAALMWGVRRHLRHSLGGERRTVKFSFPDVAPTRRHYWIVLTHDQVDVCLTDPGWDVDATITAQLRALTQVWMGDVTFSSAMRTGHISIDAPTSLARKIPAWFGREPLLGEVASAR